MGRLRADLFDVYLVALGERDSSSDAGVRALSDEAVLRVVERGVSRGRVDRVRFRPSRSYVDVTGDVAVARADRVRRRK